PVARCKPSDRDPLKRGIATMEPAIFKILIPDLPGFGKSDEPNKNWKLDDYVEFVDEFIKKASRKGGFELVKDLLKKFNPNKGLSAVTVGAKHLQKFVLIGHSFGGRIAIKYAVKYPEKIDKLILTGAAGIKHELSVKQKIFFILAKTGKKIFSLPIVNNLKKYARKFLYKAARKKDYYKASQRMKEIMKNVLAEDLTPILEKIKTPTLLAWGKLDNSTPLADGKIMNEKIENSKILVFDDANHSLPYQRAEKFAKSIINFIKKTEN
ncbi:alpha/beta fold hydrolase, partial [Patescibacteria group bacterium]|nr:alpha/beta fold hydrolase [Patescibacteria group bacterium]